MDVETLIRKEQWERARKELRRLLEDSPDDHWLLTRLGLTYYEQRRYKEALRYETKALEAAPSCPLVLWDYAGTLQMLSQHEKAIVFYKKLIRRGVARIAYGPCGEGVAWARGLVADCYYRIATSYEELENQKAGMQALTKHLDMRGPGCRSIYTLAEISKKQQKLRNQRPSELTRRSTGRAKTARR